MVAAAVRGMVLGSARHLMLVPSLGCPASCSYCFGPHLGTSTMSQDTVEAVVCWQRKLAVESDQSGPLEITFHGGEPLLPGAAFYRMALPLLRAGLAPRNIRFAVQSNLWLLTDEFVDLFSAYGAQVGTSLDGPEPINDAQRGTGYYAKTMAGVEKARAHGLSPGVVCTFTAESAQRAGEVFDFFVAAGLNFGVHAALPSARYPGVARWSLSTDAHGDLLEQLLDRYLDNLGRVRIGTLDSMARSISAGRGGICTFTDCLGEYLAVGPDGAIYPCQRFAGMPAYVLGNVTDQPGLAVLAATPVWQAFAARQDTISEECGDCAFLPVCRGGCPYNAAVTGQLQRRDPHCDAYRRTFSRISDLAVAEVFAPENLHAVADEPGQPGGLFRKGRLLSIMRNDPHPSQVAGNARQILAAVALAATGDPAEAARRLHTAGAVQDVARTTAAITRMHSRLSSPTGARNNIYLHVTFACNLHCTHCYANAEPDHRGVLTVAELQHACHEASAAGFRQAVITGGEPLVHPQRDAMLDMLTGLRDEVKPMLTVLRTSLATHLSPDLLSRLSRATDQIAVSVDGDQETHDTRRGLGSYHTTVRNLRALVAAGGDTDISLATVLPARQANGPAGDSVRALAEELGIRRVRFRPLLPLGRAVDTMPDLAPEAVAAHVDPADAITHGINPTNTCGFGQNLYVEPDGWTFPCYAVCSQPWRLGNINHPDGLRLILGSERFAELAGHTVDTNHTCQHCPLRYLCGGACRAWNPAVATSADLDTPPVNCRPLHARAHTLVTTALDSLTISQTQWHAAGLPLPSTQPHP